MHPSTLTSSRAIALPPARVQRRTLVRPLPRALPRPSAMAPSRRIDAVFFDLDDTLVMTSRNDEFVLDEVALKAQTLVPGIDGAAVVHEWRKLFKATPWDPEKKMEVEEWRGSLWARAAAEALAALDSSSTSVPADMGAALQSTFREGRLAAFRFAPGFVPLLSRLRSSGRRTAIITNGHARVQREKVEACGAAKEVDVVLVGGEEIERGCGHEKPHPSIFEKACGLLGVDAGACAMVGDSYKADVQGARNAGLALAVWVNPSGAAAPGDVHDAEVGDALDVEEVVERYERGESPALPLVSPELLPPEAEALVFDLDGTVLDTMGHHWLAWKETAHRYGLVMTQRMLSQVAGMPTREIFAKLAREQGKEGTFDIPTATKEKTQAYLRHSGETGTIRPVMRILRQARKQGLKVAAATGGNRAQITLSLAQSGLWRPGDHTYFDAVITSDEVTHGKPHPETFLMAAEALGVEPAKCVGYEDAPYGMQAIKAAGFLKAIDVTKIPGYPQPEDD